MSMVGSGNRVPGPNGVAKLWLQSLLISTYWQYGQTFAPRMMTFAPAKNSKYITNSLPPPLPLSEYGLTPAALNSGGPQSPFAPSVRISDENVYVLPATICG